MCYLLYCVYIQLKRQARLRREFIYRRSIEVRDAENEKKKKMLKVALAEGKVLPKEIQEGALQLNEELDWSDDGGEGTNVCVFYICS